MEGEPLPVLDTVGHTLTVGVGVAERHNVLVTVSEKLPLGEEDSEGLPLTDMVTLGQ